MKLLCKYEDVYSGIFWGKPTRIPNFFGCYRVFFFSIWSFKPLVEFTIYNRLYFQPQRYLSFSLYCDAFLQSPTVVFVCFSVPYTTSEIETMVVILSQFCLLFGSYILYLLFVYCPCWSMWWIADTYILLPFSLVVSCAHCGRWTELCYKYGGKDYHWRQIYI